MRKHPFHLVDPSPWPIFASFAAFLSTVGGVMYMHAYSGGGLVLSLGQSMILYSMFVWWRDVIRESTYQGHHTSLVQYGLRYGMILFIVSEVMFFLAFFWAFFHSSLAPSVEIGAVWPPKGIQSVKSLGNSVLKHSYSVILRSSRDVGSSCNSCRAASTSNYWINFNCIISSVFYFFSRI